MTVDSLAVLLSQCGTSLLFHVWFYLLLLDLHTHFTEGRYGGLGFPPLKEFSKVYYDPHIKGLCSQWNRSRYFFWNILIELLIKDQTRDLCNTARMNPCSTCLFQTLDLQGKILVKVGFCQELVVLLSEAKRARNQGPNTQRKGIYEILFENKLMIIPKRMQWSLHISKII